MKPEEDINNEEINELPDSWWYKVYVAVIIFTIFIIAALWAFSNYFSN